MKILYRIFAMAILAVTYLAVLKEIVSYCEFYDAIYWVMTFSIVYFGAIFYLVDLRHDPSVSTRHSKL